MADKDLLPTPSYADALHTLMELARWTRAEVEADVHSAYWVASGWIARCKRVVEEDQR